MNKEIVYERINEPKLFNNVPPVTLTDKTLEERKEKLLSIMAKEQYDALIIYADKEHGSNFEYFTGFIPAALKKDCSLLIKMVRPRLFWVMRI